MCSSRADDRGDRRGRSHAGRRNGRRGGAAPDPWRDRRPGALPRAGTDAQGGSAHRVAGVRCRRRHDVSGNAQHRPAATITQAATRRKAAAGGARSRWSTTASTSARRRTTSPTCVRRRTRRASRSSSAPARATCWSTSRTALERIFAETTLPITAHCEDEATVRANAERFRRRRATWPCIRRFAITRRR